MKKIYTFISAAMFFSFSALATNYPGNGNTGFGGPVGTGSLDITNDDTSLTITFNRGGANGFNDALVIYFDSQAGGFATTDGFMDALTTLRVAISGYDPAAGRGRATFNFTSGFEPDFALAFQPGNGDSAILVLLQNTEHLLVDSVFLTNSTDKNASTYTVQIPISDLGLTTDITFKFMATYISNTAYRSDEAVGDPMAGFAQGWNPYSSTSNPLAYNGVMPVVLNSFNGVLKNQSVNLTWATATEINTKEFEVEKSNDRIKWNNIASIAAKNNASGSIYSYTDNTVVNAQNYYRLKIVDNDGKFAYSNVINVEKVIRRSVKLMGNPVKNSINLNIVNESFAQYTLELFAMNGKKVGSQIYSHSGGVSNTTFNIRAGVKGMCMLVVTNGNDRQVLPVLIQ